MANITEEHLHHLAKRYNGLKEKHAGLREKFAGHLSRFTSTMEAGVGAWMGGAIEGYSQGATLPVVHIPINLAIGGALLAVGHFHFAGEQWDDHANNLGNGFIASYLAAIGYAWGKRSKETGKWFGHHSLSHPYDEVTAEAKGELSDAQMAAIVQRMQQSAAAHP